MNNFRKPKNNQRKPRSIDGFVPNGSAIDGQDSGVRKRFHKTYSPKQSPPERKGQSLGEISQAQSGFRSRNSNIQNVASSTYGGDSFDLDLSAKPTKNRIFGRKKDGSKRNWRGRIVKGFAVSFLALLIAVGSLFTYGYIKTRQVFRGNGEGAAALQQNVDPERLNGEGDGRINILLIGKGGPGHEAPDLTDSLLLASIDPVQNEAALVSVPRDLYVKDGDGYSTKINAIYANAKQESIAANASEDASEDTGLRAIKNSVTEVLGVPVHYYVMVNFQAFEDAINIVGGLTIDVQERLVDPTVAWKLGGDPVVADVGLQTLDGERALLYARSRKGSARGDFDRTERQREIVVALQQEILSAGTFANPIKIVELLSTFGDNVRTDLNGIDEIRRLYEIGRDIGSDKIVSVDLAGDPLLVTTDLIANQSVVVPTEGLYQYDDIHVFVRNTLRDAFLKQEDARVAILNGTDVAGLATAKEQELKSYGYNVVLVDNAPTSSYAATKLIDLSLGANRYTESYLERRLGITASVLSSPGLPTNDTVDFVIILGNDEAIKTSQN